MYDILEFGAVADGVTVNTEAIQTAVDTCSLNGGGKVVIPLGDFVTGTVYLKDNVEFYISSGATLIASTNREDFNSDDAYPQNYGCAAEGWTGQHLIIAHEVKNVTVSGHGVIDGRGDYYFDLPSPSQTGYGWRYGMRCVKDKQSLRPGQLICFIECENVKVTDISIRNTTCWCLFLYGCENVQVKGLEIYNNRSYLNADGIDVDCCKNATVSDCVILTADDGITVRCSSKKLKKYRACENITVSDCIIRASACGMRFGVGEGEIKNVKVSGLTIADCGTALLLQTRYGKFCHGRLQDIHISDVLCKKSGRAFQITAPDVGFIKNVTLSNMNLKTYTGVFIGSTGDGEVSDITLKDIKITIEKEGDEFVETPKSAEFKGTHPIRVNSTRNVTLDNVEVFKDEDVVGYDNGLIANEDNENLSIENCNFK